MSRAGLSDGLLTLALVGAGAVLLVLIYGAGTRALTPRTVPTRSDGFDRVQVEVRNAADVDGLAADATAHLRRRGFDVVEVGNAPAQDSSVVVVQAGTVDDARHVAGAFGLPPDRVRPGAPPSDYALDVTLYLGRDAVDFVPRPTP